MFHPKKIKDRIFQIIFLLLFSLPLHSQENEPSDTSYFVSSDDNYNLILATDKEDTLSIKLLLNRGANINTTTFEGVTPLMYASERGNLELVKLLTEKGADVNLKPFNGATALIVASKQNYYEIAEFLVSRKAELNLRDIEGVSAVHYAAAYNNFDIMDMLAYYGADLELSDNKGNTPLISAAYNNCLEAADLLIQNGANPDTTDQGGNTALMTAIQKDNIDIALLLIDKGANIHAINKAGYSALTFAVNASNYELSETLINMGADVNQKTESGYSILEIARLVKNDEIAELLEFNDAEKNPNPHFNNLSLGPYFDFNSGDYMNGFQVSLQDSKYGFGINGGFGFRPSANRVLIEESETLRYQYWERRYYFYTGIDKKFDFIKSNDIATGPYLGINEFLTFGGYRGSDENPPKKLITVPSAGWYYSGNNFRTWLAYQRVNYKTSGLNPGRINFGISVNISLVKKGFINKRIDWLE